jgi:hypothetical protein|tara:strand:+ start:643 stop:891 length:249 start_codon:yes stop_codon:yes gene_type:complete
MSKSIALDLALGFIDEINNEIIEEKIIKIKIINRNAFMDYLVTDTSKNPDKDLESKIWKSLIKVMEEKYGVIPNSWETKRID